MSAPALGGAARPRPDGAPPGPAPSAGQSAGQSESRSAGQGPSLDPSLDPASPPAPLGRRGRLVGIGVAVGLLALVAVGNAHLLYVALASQPPCVPHLKAPGEEGAGLRAAKSSC